MLGMHRASIMDEILMKGHLIGNFAKLALKLRLLPYIAKAEAPLGFLVFTLRAMLRLLTPTWVRRRLHSEHIYPVHSMLKF
jgi:hypothetical protein